jgi:hypothetical protein
VCGTAQRELGGLRHCGFASPCRPTTLNPGKKFCANNARLIPNVRGIEIAAINGTANR